MDLSFITPELRQLRDQFNRAGFDLRLVGGVVRDTLAGIPSKDVDLCTDATPEQQIQIYEDNGHRFIPTGLQHGTVTVVLAGEPHEITSLRVDVSTDGRHAEVAFTSDWHTDLQRRDLTINAMAMTFDGEIIDPFGGRADLADGIVRFVGDAEQRICEDYLRILRFFRFHGRFGKSAPGSGQWVAIRKNAAGLKQISRERVWSEMQRIVVQDNGPALLSMMEVVGVNEHIDLPRSNQQGRACREIHDWCRSPELLMAAWCDWNEARLITLSENWKWSRAERDHAEWIYTNAFTGQDLRRLIAIDGVPREWVLELAKLEQRDEMSQFVAEHWHFEPFPVSGHDLMKIGFKPGKVMGQVLRHLKEEWARSDYTITKRDLLDRVSPDDVRG